MLSRSSQDTYTAFTVSRAACIDSSDHCFCFFAFLGLLRRAGADLDRGLPLRFPRLGTSDIAANEQL